jgi:hypothetical protein
MVPVAPAVVGAVRCADRAVDRRGDRLRLVAFLRHRVERSGRADRGCVRRTCAARGRRAVRRSQHVPDGRGCVGRDVDVRRVPRCSSGDTQSDGDLAGLLASLRVDVRWSVGRRRDRPGRRRPVDLRLAVLTGVLTSSPDHGVPRASPARFPAHDPGRRRRGTARCVLARSRSRSPSLVRHPGAIRVRRSLRR